MSFITTMSLALGTSKFGLTLHAQLIDTSGTNVGSSIGGGFVEIGDGNYMWTSPSLEDGFAGGVKFFDAANVLLAFAAINQVEIDPLSSEVTGDFVFGTAGYALGLITTGRTPTTVRIVLIAGDDYSASEDRAIIINDDQNRWPVLTGASVNMHVVTSQDNVTTLDAPGTVRIDTGTTKSVQFELLSDQTILLTPGVPYSYAVIATLVNDHEVSLVEGRITVEGRP